MGSEDASPRECVGSDYSIRMDLRPDTIGSSDHCIGSCPCQRARPNLIENGDSVQQLKLFNHDFADNRAYVDLPTSADSDRSAASQ